MGGYGSGGGRGAGRCEQRCRLEMPHMRKLGYLTPGAVSVMSWTWRERLVGSISVFACADGIELRYQAKGEPIREFVSYAYTSAGFGRRARFQCPGCNRSCDVLYLGGRHFRCRLCLRLTYVTQYEPDYERARTKAHKFKRKIDPKAKIVVSSFPEKPKWMRWATYLRMQEQHDALCEQYVHGFELMVNGRFFDFRQARNSEKSRW
jgi:hypothetical protein